jgi:hypothetical protein
VINVTVNSVRTFSLQQLRVTSLVPNNFIYWGIALFIIGAAGYYKPLKPLSNAFLGLVILVLFISNRGFFARFMEQIKSTTIAQSNFSASNSIEGNLGGIISILGVK